MESENKPRVNLANITIPDIEKQIEDGRRNWLKCQREDRNRLSYWFERILSVEEHGVRLPDTVVIEIPERLFDCFFLEREDDRKQIEDWARENIMLAVKICKLPLFVKNGCFSNKFDFANSCLLDSRELKDVVDHICNIQLDSLIFETSGNLEIVLREYIKPDERWKTIYNGMPFRPEMRVFYDFDTHEYLYDVNYWDWDYCHLGICNRSNQDRDVYTEQYSIVTERLHEIHDRVVPIIKDALASVHGLTGRWSVDFLFEGDDIWLIDMAEAHRSAYWDEGKIEKH